MPTPKTKNKKPVAVKSGGGLTGKSGKKVRVAATPPATKKKKPIHQNAPQRKKGIVRIVKDENLLILSPKQFVELADALHRINVKAPEPANPTILLSPELAGWEVVESLPRLFVLYRRGIEYGTRNNSGN